MNIHDIKMVIFDMDPYRNIEYFEKRKEFIRRKRKIAKNRVAAANPTYV